MSINMFGDRLNLVVFIKEFLWKSGLVIIVSFLGMPL